MASGDLFHLAIIGRMGLNQLFVNNLHYIEQTTPSGNAAKSLVDGFVDLALTPYSQLLPADYNIDTVRVIQITGAGTAAWEQNVNLPGELTGDPLPPQDAPILRFKTGLTGRNQQGRIYIPAPNEAMQASGVVSVTFRGAMENVGAAMLNITDTPSGGEFGLVIFHRLTSTADLVTTAIAGVDIGTQRRRKARRSN